LIGCTANAPSTQRNGADSSAARTIESFSLDLDGDRRPDSLQLIALAYPTDPGRIVGLRVRLANGRTDSLTGNWDPARDDYASYDNSVPSRDVFVHTYPGAGTLIFLFGEDVGCCLQSLDVVRASARGLQHYFHRDAFALIQIMPPIGADPAFLIGYPSQSESTGTADTLKSSTYTPIHVIRLAAAARLDTARSIAWTRSRLGGFAGLEPRNDIEAVQELYLWDSARRRRLR
jgi:hypothetical protein